MNQGDIDCASARRELMREVSDDLTDFLEENRQEEARLREELRHLRDERSELLWSAHADGLNMSAMARAGGVNRQMAYELVREAERRREPERDVVPRSPEETATVELHGPEPAAAQVREIVRPTPPGDDIRFTRVENAADSLRTLPAKIAWPTEPGDITAMDEAFAFLTTWLPAAKTSWTQHKKDLNKAKAEDKKKAGRANEALDTDPRYLSVEDGVAVLDLLPAADQIVWPVEAFDVDMTDRAMLWMDKEWPSIRASWRIHKARGLLPRMLAGPPRG